MLDTGRWCRGRGRRRTKEKNMQRGNVRVGGAHATTTAGRDWLSLANFALATDATLRIACENLTREQRQVEAARPWIGVPLDCISSRMPM